METREYTTVDRSTWISGAWDNEPDKVQWQDSETGLPCLAVRNSHMGFWCGYVGVSENHPLFQMGYNDIYNLETECELTFAGHCQRMNDESIGICHVPSPGESDRVWWLGFDFGHHCDSHPYELSRAATSDYYIFEDATYKTLSYVKEHCVKLAKQLANYK